MKRNLWNKPNGKAETPHMLMDAGEKKNTFFQSDKWTALKKAIDARHGKSDLLNFTVLLTNMMTLMAWRTMDLTKAEYEGKAATYWFCVIATYVILAALVWHIVCLVGCEGWGRVWNWVRSRPQAAVAFCKGRSTPGKISIAVIPLVILVIAGIAYFRPHSTYYAQIGERYGFPVGEGGSLSAKERRGLASYWRIDDYPWQRKATLTYVEAYGQLELISEYSTLYERAFFQPASQIKIEYRKDKEEYKRYQEDYYDSAKEIGYRVPLHIVYYNSGEKPVLELRRNSRGNMEITGYVSEDAPQLLNSTLLRVPDDQNASRRMIAQQIETVYNSDGLPQRRRLCSQAYNLYGVNGEQYSYNQDRQLSTLCYLDADGNPVCNKLGIMMVEFEYRDDGKLQSIRYYSDQNGTERVEGFHGVFCEILDYDEEGKNIVSRRQRDRGENWCYDSNGVYQYTYQYQDGFLEQESFWGVDEAPVQDSRFNSRWIKFYAEDHRQRIRMELEAVGGTMEETEQFPDMAMLKDIPTTWNAAPLLLSAPVDTLETGRGEPPRYKQNAPQEEPSENLAPNRRYSVIQYNLKKGVVNEISYWDSQGNPVAGEQGCAVKRFEYDSQMRVVRESYWDGDGQSCRLTGGYAAVEYVYCSGESQDLERTIYMDSNGLPAINRDLGCAIVRYEYSGPKRETVRKSYYDRKDSLMALPDVGYAEVEQRYDSNGFLIQETFYNVKHAVACRIDTGAAKIRYEYSPDGNLIRESYWDQEDCAVSRRDTGYALVSQTFSNGQLVEKRYEAYRGRAYHPVPDRKSGAAVITYQYKNGQKVEERYLDGERAPVLRTDLGCASLRFEYEAGRLHKTCAYGLDEELVLRTDYGCAVIEYGYDEYGRRETVCYYDTDEQLVERSDTGYAKIKYGYDEFGRDSFTKYYDAAEQLVIRKDGGYAGCTYQYSGGNNQEWQYIGLDGQPMLRREGYGVARVKKDYDPAGNLLKESYQDIREKPAVWKDHGYSSFEYSYYENGDRKEERFYDREGNLTPWTEKGYAVRAYEYDDCGRILRSLYYDRNREPVISAKYYCAGMEYEYDERGNQAVIRYLGPDGRPMIRSDFGVAEIRQSYDSAGNLESESYFDTDGKPVLKKECGYASFLDTFDNGLCVESRYFDTEDKPIMRADRGYAVIKNEFDPYGRCVRELYYDTEENPVISTYYHCAGFEYEYDQRGKTSVIRYLGLDGKPMVRSDKGFAEVRKAYDETGNLISEHYFDCDEKPAVYLEGGYASYQDTFEKGRVVKSEYFDADGAAAVRKDRGYASIEWTYDGFGQITACRYYNAAGDLTINQEYGCAGFRYAYDDFGNQTDIWYVGPEGAESIMVREKLGYAHVRYEYNELGQETAAYYYLSEDESRPAAEKDTGCFSYEKSFENGRCTQIVYRDEKGTPMLRSDRGYAIVRYTYNDRGEETSAAYLGADGETLVVNRYYGCAEFQYGYDERGNQTNIWYIGSDGELVLRNEWGLAHIVQGYDDIGNLVSEDYYSDRERTQPVAKKKVGCAGSKSVYENGKCVEKRFYDAEGNLALCQEGSYAIVRYTYNECGQLVAVRYYGRDETPVMNTEEHCAGKLYAYNERGLRTDTWYIGLDDSCINRDDRGYAHVHSEYDAEGNEIYVEYRNTDEKLTPHKTYGFAYAEYEYKGGKDTAGRFFDQDGNPVPRKDYGYAAFESFYDEDGNWIESRYYDAQGNLTRRTDWDLAVIRKEYDEKNRCVLETYYDEFEHPAISQNFYCAGFGYKYDEKGNETAIRYIGPDGKPMLRGGGYGFASVRKEYDDQGRLLREHCLDLEGNPAVWEEYGYSSRAELYDEYGRAESTWYYDTEGKLVSHKVRGFAFVRYDYNEMGLKTRESYYGTDQEPVLHKKYHCAGIEYGYDVRGNMTYRWYYGKDGELLDREDFGASMYLQSYDELDHMTWEGYYTLLDGEWKLAVRRDEGYAAVRNEYDENGFWMGRTYLDADENPVVYSKQGYATQKRLYDENGQLRWNLYLDADGEPVDTKEQYAKEVWTHNQAGIVEKYNTYRAGELSQDMS